MAKLMINDLEFVNGTRENGAGPTYDLLPTAVLPKQEIIKTAERSLNGTMCVDITAVKKMLTVSFDLLADKEFSFLKEFLGFDSIECIDAAGLAVTYFDSVKDGENASIPMKCFIDSVTYMPFIVGDEIKWRDVVIELVEI